MRIVFYGGMQAKRLALAYVREADEPQGGSWLGDRHAPSESAVETLRTADAIVWIDGGAPPLDLDDLDSRAEIIRLPELQLDFLWPFGGQPHIANAGDDLYPDGPFPAELGDAWLNRALEGPQRAEVAEATYLALDVARVVDLDRMRDLALKRQAERDRLCGVDFAGLVEAEFKTPSLFLSPRTPGRRAFGALAQAAFARLGLVYSGAAETEPAVRALPIHPSVAAHFGLPGATIYDEHWGGRVDFAEYVRRYLAFAEGPELEHGLGLLAVGRAEAAEERLEIAAARSMGRRSASARRGLAHASVMALSDPVRRAGLSAFAAVDIDDPDILTVLTAFARGRLAAAESRMMAHLAQTPDRAENFAVLATIRETRGDPDGALAALEAAVGVGTRDAKLMGRFALALAARGEMMAAASAVDAEIALDPQNPHPYAYRAQLLVHVGWRSRAEAALEAGFAVAGAAPEGAALRATLEETRAALAR